MRIGDRSRSALETPLDWIFSSPANVRILRELSLAGAPLARSEIARRSGISLAGVVKALPRLLAGGVVEQMGTGRGQVAIRQAHPFSGVLALLFRTEALRKQQLTGELADLAARSEPPVRSAWIEEDAGAPPHAPMVVGVLAGSAEVSAIQDVLRPAVADLSARFGLPLELSVRTVPDLAALAPDERERLEGVTPLFGPNPLQLSPDALPDRSPGPRTHADREAASLRRAMWIAERLDHDPTLPGRARSWIVHRLHESPPREAADYREWLHLLDSASIPTLQYVLLRVDERSDRLRQTNPFIMALTPDERSRMAKETAG